ncbi:MAG: hypothetical protein AAGD32_06185 [Planctomycetota bacterium]
MIVPTKTPNDDTEAEALRLLELLTGVESITFRRMQPARCIAAAELLMRQGHARLIRDDLAGTLTVQRLRGAR